jgi:type VI secretion system secreted protein VgrG
MATRLLTLKTLGAADVSEFMLVSFEGREAMSEPFDYRLQVSHIGSGAFPTLTEWIGKLAEFDLEWNNGPPRSFAGRIYEARRVHGESVVIELRVRPAYHALAYARGTHLIQDKTAVEIFNAMTADLSGLVKTVDANVAVKRAYCVRYDESEIDFLNRLLARDGIFYFFQYDSGGGPYKHKMVVGNAASSYVDVDAAPFQFLTGDRGQSDATTLQRDFSAAPTTVYHRSLNVALLHDAWGQETSSADEWSAVYSHKYETIGDEADTNDLAASLGAEAGGIRQRTDFVSGSSGYHEFFAGGRVEIDAADGDFPSRVVLTSVQHSAYDPPTSSGGKPSYRNSFTAMPADDVFRPPVGEPQRRAPGPMLGIVDDKSSQPGKVVVDSWSRIPVRVAGARVYDNLPEFIWLPVQQQWASDTHGAQFFPRTSARVLIDFLYGNPDLPFVSGSIYTETNRYPFDPASTAMHSGWRSVTDENGSVTQELRFEDKPSEERVYLYTGRNFERQVDKDEIGTVNENETLTVKMNRTRTVNQKEEVTVDQTRTMTVKQKSLHQSDQEIEIKVGASSIVLKPDKITIKAPQIEITADATLKMSGGASSALDAPKNDITSAGVITVQGTLVKIN